MGWALMVTEMIGNNTNMNFFMGTNLRANSQTAAAGMNYPY
jgi:hypothetical protein